MELQSQSSSLHHRLAYLGLGLPDDPRRVRPRLRTLQWWKVSLVRAGRRPFAPHTEGVLLMELKARIHCCEEASPMSHNFYIPCNAPAVFMVKSRDPQT